MYVLGVPTRMTRAARVSLGISGLGGGFFGCYAVIRKHQESALIGTARLVSRRGAVWTRQATSGDLRQTEPRSSLIDGKIRFF